MEAPLNDNSLMPFGRYKGKKLANVPAPYLLWLFDNKCDHKPLMNYIVENIVILRKEAGPIRFK